MQNRLCSASNSSYEQEQGCGTGYIGILAAFRPFSDTTWQVAIWMQAEVYIWQIGGIPLWERVHDMPNHPPTPFQLWGNLNCEKAGSNYPLGFFFPQHLSIFFYTECKLNAQYLFTGNIKFPMMTK